MQRENIVVQIRNIFGKKIKKLRREGVLPANVYGKDIKSTAVQLSIKDFTELYKKVRETGLVDLKLDSQTMPVLIHNVAWSPADRTPLHADFFKVNLKEKIKSKISVVATGEALAVLDKKGVLLQPMGEVEVEALPTDLPEKIEVAVDALAEVGDQIITDQLTLPNGVTLVTETGQVVFKIGELVQEEPEPVEETPAEGEEAGADATGEAESGETPAEEKADAEKTAE